MKKIIILLAVILSLTKTYSQVGSYLFINGTTTYTSLAGAAPFTINGGGGNTDDGYSAAQTIPFLFNFGGTDYTQYVVSSNGFVAFGTSLTASEYNYDYNTYTGTRNNVICFTNRDLNNSGTVYSNVTEGTAPNRIHKIQCANFYQYNTTTRTGNCQIWLYEGSNKIEIRYGAYATTWTLTCRVGIRGISASDLKTLNGTGATAWTNPASGNLNTSTMNQASPVNADNGRIYSFYLDNTPMTYVSGTTTQNTSLVYQNNPNQHIIGLQITTSGSVAPFNLTSLVLNTNGSTNPAGDISNAKVYYTGTNPTFTTAGQFGSAFNNPNGSFSISGSQQLVTGVNYFWITYDIPSGAVVGNVVDAECNQIVMSGTGGTQTPAPQAPAGNRTIAVPLSGVNVGTGQTYTSLTGAGGLFEAINNGSLQINTNLTANVTSNLTETGSIALNQWANPYSITIRPADNVEKLISGNSATSAMVLLNGADNVIIDGRFNGSGKYLRFRNTSTTRPVIGLINDAMFNTIRDCIVESNNTTTIALLSTGVINLGTTTGSSGNDSNIITNCDIRNRSDITGRPEILIYSRGNNSTITNDKNSVTNCNLYNFTSSGILLRRGSEGSWTISGNSIYCADSVTGSWNGILTANNFIPAILL